MKRQFPKDDLCVDLQWKSSVRRVLIRTIEGGHCDDLHPAQFLLQWTCDREAGTNLDSSE
jgi:hypothetical protein